MRILLLALIFSIQVFGAAHSSAPGFLTARQKMQIIAPLLDHVSPEAQDAVEESIITSLGQITQEDAQRIVGVVGQILQNLRAAQPVEKHVSPASPPYNAVVAPAEHAAVVAPHVGVAPVVAPAALRKQRYEEFMAEATTMRNLDQAFDSLKPYIERELANLQNLPLEQITAENWKTILKDLTANMDTGGASGPSRFNKALASIEPYLPSQKRR